MRVLLDSHALIWGTVEPHRLSARARQVLAGIDDELVISISTLWEITIKMTSGKLKPLGSSIRDVFSVLRKSAVEVLPIQTSHLVRLESLPLHHRDPFDRMLIAQAIEEAMPVLTDDTLFASYPVTTLW